MILSIIIPSHQEEATIQNCLRSIIAQTVFQNRSIRAEVIVVANACTDATAERARSLESVAQGLGLGWTVIVDPIGGKTRALNRGDDVARGDFRIYLDADVVCGPTLVEELVSALDSDAPLYASGTVSIPRSKSWFSRCYARFWTRLPFVASDVAGYGLYAVNAAGRQRWADFPDLHSDDKFVRLLFKSSERRRVAATYSWPIPDGILNLVNVRRRWCEGNAQLRGSFPELHSDPYPGTAWQYACLMATTPVSAVVFSIVYAGGALLARGREISNPIQWRRAR